MSAGTSASSSDSWNSSVTSAPTSATIGDATSESTDGTGLNECGLGESCLPVSRDPWQGPVYLVDRDFEGPATVCPDGTDLDPTQLNFGLEAPPADCGCGCGVAQDAVCDSTTLEFHGNDPTCATPDTSHVITHEASGGGNCENEPTGPVNSYWRAAPLGLSGGSCAATMTEVVDAAGWEGSSDVCNVDLSNLVRCNPDGVCAGPSDPSFAHSTCLWQEGDHGCEGLGPFQDRQIRWTGVDDSRGCSTCTCGAPEGECAGVLWLRGTIDCLGPLDLMPTDDSCFQSDVSVQSARIRTGAPGCEGECQVVASASCAAAGGDSVGSAEPTGVQTFCCTE